MLLEINEPGASEKQKNKSPKSDVAVGIDLGTTNSVIAISKNGKSKALGDEKLLASLVSYSGKKAVVGKKAREALVKRQDTVFRSVKKLMGKGIKDIKKISGWLPYRIHRSSNENMIYLDADGKKVTAVDISSEILKKLKKNAEKSLSKKIKKAVITVPAYFDDAARAATKDAAKLAGIEVLRLINEPTAAALAYGLDNNSEGIYAVYDLGGGTFDISILKMEKGVFRVIATAGDTSLGGDDFDHAIVMKAISDLNQKIEDEDELNLLLEQTKKIKESLTSKKIWKGKIKFKKKRFDFSISRNEFEDLINQDVKRSLKICLDAVSDSGLDISEIKGVVMVGGSTRIPFVRENVAKLFGQKPLTNIDPDFVVAFGAAIQAESLTRGEGTLLLDVNPLSLGIETIGGLVEKIIERNTLIPVAKSQEFTTHKDGQTGMKIHVLQGERERADLCRSLAHFELSGIPPMQAGIARIKVTFSLDADGLLTVSAREETSGKEQQIEVKPSYGLADKQIEKMLMDSYKNAKQDIFERLLSESRLEAQIMLDNLEKALESDGDLLETSERKAIDKAVAQLKAAMKGSNRDDVDIKAQELDKICSDFAEKRVNRALSDALRGKNVDEVVRSKNA